MFVSYIKPRAAFATVIACTCKSNKGTDIREGGIGEREEGKVNVFALR